ncbi:deleted in malignant brain tumors 1 -like, partial [Paramuricea clavata]
VSVRLRGPSSSNGNGRVEVFYNGRWGTICHYNWDIWDARVVCRQLGYGNAVRALRGYRPHGTGQIWLSYVGCTGNEENLISCSHNGWGNHNCGHYEDAGVECSGKDISVRLRGPSRSNGTGRVEVLYNGRWGTICDNSWDINDARVVCRQLGYQYTVRALRGYEVPDGTGQIWLNYVRCTGRERNLITCRNNGWRNHTCGHYKDAGVECSSTDVDECSRGLDTCRSNSQCVNTIGTFLCNCNPGYTGYGVNCYGE